MLWNMYHLSQMTASEGYENLDFQRWTDTADEIRLIHNAYFWFKDLGCERGLKYIYKLRWELTHCGIILEVD